MKRRVIKTGAEAREALERGADALAKAVGSTLGPFGLNFFLDKKDTITNDGVSIAREFQLSDELENRGVKAIREAALKTVDEAGDGTTTSIVLANEIYKAAKRFLGKTNVAAQKRPSEIVKQIQKECEEVIAKLKERATPITSKEQLVQSATVSTEDPELGKLIGEAQWELGEDGVLIVEDSNDKTCSVERVTGLRLDNGFGSSGVVNNQEKWQMEVENCAILLTTFTIKTSQDFSQLLKAIEPALKAGITDIVVVARAWTDETINFCLQNIQRGAGIYPLNAPYENMTERMKDLAAVTGATFYDSESSELSDIMQSGLGKAQKVIGRRMESIIEGVVNEKTKESVQKRIESLKETRDGSESSFEKASLSKRIAQLENGFAIVRVGSPSDMEKRRVLDKADDAIHAVKASLQEGTIKGAGLEAYEIAKELPDTYLLKRPLMSIYEQIMHTAPEGFVVEEWVRDPLKVWRVALTHACSAAASFATAEGVITEKFPTEMQEFFKQGNG